MDYFSRLGNAIYMLRLIAEGAYSLFETDTPRLLRLASENSVPEATAAYETIGAALTEMLTRIRTMQQEYVQEALRDRA